MVEMFISVDNQYYCCYFIFVNQLCLEIEQYMHSICQI